MKKLVVAALLFGAATVSAQDRQRLDRSCRQEVVKLCGMNRGEIRTCLRDSFQKLSKPCLQQLMKMRGAQGGGRAEAATGRLEIAYGNDRLQTLDFWPAAPGGAKPALVVFIHGGGWSIGDKAQGAGTKPAFYTSQGFAFASLNYRLVPQVKPDDQARDVAAALARLRSDAGRLGFDPDQIFLSGHSAGAHLAALVSTDTRILEDADVPLRAVRGTVLLDGAGYDVAKQMADQGNRAASLYDAAFTRDPATQKRLSPITYAGAPNSPRWLILHVASRPDSRAQSEGLGRALAAAGARVDVKPVPDSSHMTVNRDAGVAGTFVGDAILAFLKG